MAGFTMGIDLKCKTNAYIEIEQGRAKYWENLGLSVFEGDFEGLGKVHPEVIQELLKRGLISET